MAQVSVSINNKAYRMACADGEEDHLRGLALRVDDLIRQFRSEFGEIGDQRLTVMAAIRLADDLETARRDMAVMRDEASRLSRANSVAQETAEMARESAARVIAEAAARVSEAARRLGTGAAPA
jgi:cell division protein ZapA